MLLNTLKWYEDFRPHEISAKDIEHHLIQAKNYHNGVDKQNRQVQLPFAKINNPDYLHEM